MMNGHNRMKMHIYNLMEWPLAIKLQNSSPQKM